MVDPAIEELLRELAPQVLGALTRRYGHFDVAEDATQEALLAAARQWPGDGLPDHPRGWLITVGSRRMTDLLRTQQARQRREDVVAQRTPADQWFSPAADHGLPEADDTLILLFLCCHPVLSGPSQVALTLRAVGGLRTAEIARAFLVDAATMTRRITRAKKSIADSGQRFRMPDEAERAGRLDAVLRVLYLIFNEGYAATSGPALQRIELAAEAIRLTRMLHRRLPGAAEVAGLLALMLLTDARRPARSGPQGELVAMADQDRRLWRTDAIAEGVALITETLPRGPVGPYQLQAAIAAVHDEAPTADDTDWRQIAALYDALLGLGDNPVVRLNRAVAVAMDEGPRAGLDLLDELEADPRLADDHRLPAARAHLLESTGDHEAAYATYLRAVRRARSLPQQRYLIARAERLRDQSLS